MKNEMINENEIMIQIEELEAKNRSFGSRRKLLLRD